MITVSIDCGLRGCGVGVFRDKKLLKAGYVKNPEQEKRGAVAWIAMAMAVDAWLNLEQIDQVVLETMHSYELRQQKGDQNDLLEVNGVAGALAGLLATGHNVTSYLPSQWKGQVPKDVHNKRVMNALTPDEADAFAACPASLKHNVIDGVGIGLFALGRMGATLNRAVGLRKRMH